LAAETVGGNAADDDCDFDQGHSVIDHV
jgi:hypothetical protein